MQNCVDNLQIWVLSQSTTFKREQDSENMDSLQEVIIGKNRHIMQFSHLPDAASHLLTLSW